MPFHLASAVPSILALEGPEVLILVGSSWLTSGHPGDPGWSATSVNSSNQPSPSRREYAVQPPPLTTALSGHQFQGLGVAVGAGYASTPLSTTSLSSPFTQGLSPRVPSPGSAVGSSPMASRQPSYNVPYNPRDWGPVNGGQPAYPHINNNLLRVVPHQPQPGHHSGPLLFFPLFLYTMTLHSSVPEPGLNMIV